MKASELIQELQKAIEKFGDKEVEIYDTNLDASRGFGKLWTPDTQDIVGEDFNQEEWEAFKIPI